MFFAGFLITGILFYAAVATSFGQGSRIIILWPNPETAKSSLQLQTFPFVIVPPPPASGSGKIATESSKIQLVNNKAPSQLRGNYCPADYVKSPGETCECWDMNAIACPAGTDTVPTCPQGQIPFMDFMESNSRQWYCAELIGLPGGTQSKTPPEGCFEACIAKPIVYLYPTEPTYIDVEVVAPGEVFVSDPQYPAGGWRDVLAYPSGDLVYQGSKYKELFYETRVKTKIEMPDAGIVIARERIEHELRSALFKFGLKDRELEEFLEYWVPTLENLNSDYVFFSVLTPDVKESVDKLIISPEPDTRIEIIAYFKPLGKPVDTKPLYVPESPPVRSGFTMVEWGGTIDFE